MKLRTHRFSFLTTSILAVAAAPAGTPGKGIPFKLYEGHLIVAKGYIGESKPLNFLIDTGTFPSIVDTRTFKKLGLSGTSRQYAFFSRSVEVKEAVLPSIELGSARFRDLPALVKDLSPLQRSLGIRIDAQIGLDVLKEKCRIDYRSRRIYLDPPAPLATSVRFEAGYPFVVVAVEIQGRQLHLLLDTGAQHMVLFQSRVEETLPTMKITGSKSFQNAAGPAHLRQLHLKDVRIGNQDIGKPEAFLWDAPVHDSLPYDGLLALSSLGARQVQVNFRNTTLSWEK